MTDDESLPEEIASLEAKARAIHDELTQLMPLVSEARKKYFRTRRAEDRQSMIDLGERGTELHTAFSAVVQEMQALVGLSDEVMDKLEKERRIGAKQDRVERQSLVESQVESTGKIEAILARSFDALLQTIDANWLVTLKGIPRGLGQAIFEQPLSLVRGVRVLSEYSGVHRFAQALVVSQDFLEERVDYDHFAGALLVPQTAALAEGLEHLKDVGGADRKIETLWKDASEKVEGTTFELLVASGCARLGRNVEFVTAAAEPSADLQCHDPFPLVIECKRKRTLSDYEIKEAQEMEVLFAKLRAAARATGLWGTFLLELQVEAGEAPHDEIVTALVRQRFVPHPRRPLEYPWGKIAYRELPRLVSFPRTRLYSPNMLGAVFGWNSDLPRWDGLICEAHSQKQIVVEGVEEAVGLLWVNTSDRAIAKRSWDPSGMFHEAIRQVTPGEFGLIYVAYQEGTRGQVADLRTTGFIERVRDQSHAASIRIPGGFLVRLYPRALNHGEPDLIENSIKFVADYAEPVLLESFPATVFTRHYKSE